MSTDRKMFPRRPKRRPFTRKSQIPTSLTCAQPGGFPDRYRCTLKTSHTVNTGSFAAVGYQNLFVSLNSYSPIGAQYPSQLANFLGSTITTGLSVAPYINYTVYGRVRVVVEAIVNTASTGAIQPVLVLFPLPKNSGAWTGTANTAKETTGAVFCSIEDSAAASPPNKLTWSSTMTHLTGIESKSEMRHFNNLIGSYNSAPNEVYYLNILVSTTGASATNDATYSIGLNVTVFQDYEFFNRNGPNTSAPA